MIIYDNYEEIGQIHKYVSIDLSSKKHKNRVLDFLQSTNPVTEKFEYTIKAKWTDDKFHPHMLLSESELREFAEKLNLMVEEIDGK